MKFIDLAASRYSCRSYKDETVEREKLSLCAEAARMSPSACNSQPWSFVVVDEPLTAQCVSQALQQKGMPFNKFTRNCPAYVVIIEEKAKLAAAFGGFLKNQHYAQMDIGIAAAHIALCASDLGLGSCIIGWFNNSRLRKALGIPPSKRVRLVVAIGYAKENAFRAKVRKKAEECVHYNAW